MDSEFECSVFEPPLYATREVGTDCDTGKTKITCYYAASFEHDLTRLNGLTTSVIYFLIPLENLTA